MPNPSSRLLLCLSSLVAVATVTALPACQQDDGGDLPADAAGETERVDEVVEQDQDDEFRDGALPCVSFCEARAGQLLEACLANGIDPAECEQAVSIHLSACIDRQCNLQIQIPDPSELENIARHIGHDVLGPNFELVDVVEHYWGAETIGSRVYTFASGVDGSPGFVEMGATVEQPPVVSYGFGETAEVAMHERAIELLSNSYGAQDYELTRRYFTAAHPILEYTTPQGSYYYSVAHDDVSNEFAIEDNPEVDQDELALRRESFANQWDRYLAGEFE